MKLAYTLYQAGVAGQSSGQGAHLVFTAVKVTHVLQHPPMNAVSHTLTLATKACSVQEVFSKHDSTLALLRMDFRQSTYIIIILIILLLLLLLLLLLIVVIP